MKHKILLAILLSSICALGQPVGSAPNPAVNPPNLPNTINQVERAWYRGGNLAGGSAGANNIFGTAAGFNSSIFTQTNGVNRMQLNGTINYNINGQGSVPRDGFLGLGVSTNFYFGVGNGIGPFSLLHLNGINPGGVPQQSGYRNWMRYGITSTHNQDLAFFGQRQNGSGSDITDVVVGWADNSGAGAGPDNMVFNFLSGTGSANDDLTGDAANGREIMRLTAIGNVGIGPRFNNANQPTSTLHQHQENYISSWMQITNQFCNNAITSSQTGPTSIATTDGLKWGIEGNIIPVNNGNAYVYNQENRYILFSTNHNAPDGTNLATNYTNTLERMRITSLGTPTYLGAASSSIYNPFNLSNTEFDKTRVSISHDPSNPITRPLALLHLGYNTGNAFAGAPNGIDGTRNWMEVGTLVTRTTDHVFVGLKPIGNGLLNSYNRQDAVIAWGDDYNSPIPGLNTGPDKLRIIFTSPSQGQPLAGPGEMSNPDGLEFVRYVPFHNTSLNVNDPRIGFGDFNSLVPVGTIDPGNTVEINSIMNGFNAPANPAVTGSYPGSTGASGLRFRDLTSQSTIVPSTETSVNHTKVLSVDNVGNVVLIDNGGGSGNSIGNYCGITPTNPLLNPYEIPMNGFNYNFTNPANSQSSIHIGNQSCSPTIGRLNVYNDNLQVGGVFSSNLNTATNSFGIYSTITNSGTGQIVGVQGLATTSGAGSIARGLRGEGVAANGSIAQGVKGTANTNNNCSQNIAVGGLSANGTLISISGDFDIEQSNSPTNQGINVEVINGTNASATNVGINASANSMGSDNFGGVFIAHGATNNYGIFAQSSSTSIQTPGSPSPLAGNYAGYFSGDVVRTGTDNFTSDFNLKQNIDTITDAIGIINKLKPKSFEYKQSSFPSMNLPSGKQYGFIAQDVQTILPELVNNNVHPPKLDSVGNVIIPSVNYLSLEYQQLIGIMVRAMQQQQTKIDSLTAKLNSKDSLQDVRLTALENAVNQCCSNNPASARNGNMNINQLDIELSDKDAIVLNQNVPNPFAEQTTITYNVPASVEKAQLIFFNSNGQVIQTVDIKTRGKGKVNVFAADLSSGLYHYTLVVDGKVVDSKKMVRE